MYVHALTILCLCLSIQACVTSPPPLSDAEAKRQVLATEAAFARTMADRDHEAFATFIAEDSVFFAGNEALRGKQQVVDYWARYYAEAAAPFSWQPRDVEILDSATLAHSSGPVYDPEGNLIGQFNSIWRYDGTGKWRVIFDKGNDVCACADP